MQKIFFKMTLLIAAISLTACSNMSGIPGFGTDVQAANKGLPATSVDESGRETNVNITMTGGGEIGLRSMDAQDKNKMSRALDSGTGKETHWQNGATGITYAVTPIRKVVIQGNPFCREYHVVVMKGKYRREMNGTACVTTDGSWHMI